MIQMHDIDSFIAKKALYVIALTEMEKMIAVKMEYYYYLYTIDTLKCVFEAVECGIFPLIKHGVMTNTTGSFYGDTTEITCEKGHYFTYTDTVVHTFNCGSNSTTTGAWDIPPDMYECQGMYIDYTILYIYI